MHPWAMQKKKQIIITDLIRNPMNQRIKHLPQSNLKVYILSSRIYVLTKTVISSGVEKSFNFNINFEFNFNFPMSS